MVAVAIATSDVPPSCKYLYKVLTPKINNSRYTDNRKISNTVVMQCTVHNVCVCGLAPHVYSEKRSLPRAKISTKADRRYIRVVDEKHMLAYKSCTVPAIKYLFLHLV